MSSRRTLAVAESTVTSIIQPTAVADEPLPPVTTTLTLPPSSASALGLSVPSSTSKGLPREKVIAIAASVGGAVLLIIIAAVIFFIRWKRQRSRDSFRMRTNNLRASIIGMPQAQQAGAYGTEKEFAYKADYRVDPQAGNYARYDSGDVYRGAQVDKSRDDVYRAW